MQQTKTVDRDAVNGALNEILAPFGLTTNHCLRVTFELSAIRVKHIVPLPGHEGDEHPPGIRDRDGGDEFAELTTETVIPFEDGLPRRGESK